jgi:hypothetical protein
MGPIPKGIDIGSLLPTSASATSDAVTVNGAMAQALSTAGSPGFETQATSTAKTSFAGVSVQSTAAFVDGFSDTAMTDAIAQGRSGQTAVDPSETDAVIATVLPDKAYAATLICPSTRPPQRRPC